MSIELKLWLTKVHSFHNQSIELHLQLIRLITHVYYHNHPFKDTHITHLPLWQAGEKDEEPIAVDEDLPDNNTQDDDTGMGHMQA